METHSHSIRVLVRPPPAPSPALPPQPPPPPDPSPPSKNGVVVVGFIGRRHHDVAHLINKIIDSSVFGSANLDTPLRLEPDKINAEMTKWFESRKFSSYHDEEQGILYLQFSSVRCPVTEEGSFGFESFFEDQELGDLQGLLFMFSVCHVIIFIQEGSRFDTQMLRKFRILQTAKHTMAPFVRSQNTSPITSRQRSSAQARRPSSHNNPSPGKNHGIPNRNASAITVMSGLGSHSSLLPGQCTPVILFVFLDDISENHGNMEEPSEPSSLNFSPSPNSLTRPVKGTAGPIVVLSRPTNKSEGGLRKKLQSSLEAQIRFSIKKCRTLSGLENGARSGAIASSAPLFSLDASRAVSLVDACCCQSDESLEFAIGLVEEVLQGRATPDSLLHESRQHNAIKEDILSVKEFIYRQSDLLRGRGGLVSNSNSGSSAGVGMFAAAAAAAAASTSTSTSTATSAASGKTITAPELPTLEIWSSSSQLILYGILSAKRDCLHEQDTVSQPGENLASSFESVVSQLENGVGLNSRFSTLWCEKAFPVAKEVYLENLPPCYPSSQHELHLNQALTALTSMVKGPAVKLYMKKLRDECTSIWSSGRQLCDAISLTGKPCMHQKHDEIKSHSSGFVYLHACACGRSRRLRQDPFDYETANVGYNTFADCDKLLPAVQLPEGRIKGPILPSSWNLIRVGSSRYYDSSKGLLQSGFCVTQKFLLRWTISLEKKLKEESCELPPNVSQQICLDRNAVADANSRTSDAQNGLGMKMGLVSDTTGDCGKNVIFGRGLTNFTMKKPFSEVVAGTSAASTAFPPLSSRRQPLSKLQSSGRHMGLEKLGGSDNNLESQKLENIASLDKAVNDNDDHFPHIRSKVVPLSVNNREHIKATSSIKNVTIYVGFEHECPRGHRFIVNLDHLNELGSSYSVPEENAVPFSVESSDRKQDSAKLGKIGGQSRNRRHSNGIIMAGKIRNLENSKEKVANGNMHMNKSIQSARQGKYQNDRMKVTGLVKDHDYDLKPASIDDGGHGFSLLNRNFPIYMNCPHCRDSAIKNDTSNVKFANSISQLQRIFMVTPSFPIVLASDPIIQFESSCLPASVPDREEKLQFRLGCPVILPPESFLSLRLPFVYGVEMEDGSLHSLKPFEIQPQLTAYIVKGTTLHVVSNRNQFDPALVT